MSKSNEAVISACNKGYTIDHSGRVYSFLGHEVIGSVDKRGYRRFSFTDEGVLFPVKFHKFQAYMKFGDCAFSKTIVVRHLNNNKIDNSWDNIGIGSSQDNALDIPENVRKERAAKIRSLSDGTVSVEKAAAATRKLSVEDITKIRERVKTESQRSLAKEFGVAQSAISRIKSGLLYKSFGECT